MNVAKHPIQTNRTWPHGIHTQRETYPNLHKGVANKFSVCHTDTHLLQNTNIPNQKKKKNKAIELPMNVMYTETQMCPETDYPQRPTTWKHTTQHSSQQSHNVKK